MTQLARHLMTVLALVLSGNALAQTLRDQREAGERAAELADCQASLETKVKQYWEDMRVRDYWTATLNIRRCAELLEDKRLAELVADAEVKSYLQDIQHSTHLETRIRSLESLMRDYPEQAKPFRALHTELEERRLQNSEAAKIHRRQNTRPKIGSKASQVVDESWGRPLKVHRSTTAAGEREQWVYPHGRYLYFDNGVLVAIQD